uniref:Uncharacterized protein n=1 Tax=Faecalibaculum rodentium TaxID=1702221 RepID=A0A140DWK3_9FIRM|nr:hypothetical protein AALO17_18960 [Faecalibaculum rodentium]
MPMMANPVRLQGFYLQRFFFRIARMPATDNACCSHPIHFT